MNAPKGNNRLSVDIENLVKKGRVNKLITIGLCSLLVSIITFVVLSIFSVHVVVNLSLSISVFLVLVISFISSKNYKCINRVNVLEHLNRIEPKFEESAQLLLAQPDSLSRLQRLQFSKIKRVFDVSINDGSAKQSLPPPDFKLAGTLALLALVSILLKAPLTKFITDSSNNFPISDSVLNEVKPKTVSSKEAQLAEYEVRVAPPKYTGLQSYSADNMNLTIVEGARISWSLKFTRNDLDYFFVGAGDDNKQKMKLSDTGYYTFEKQISQTSIYRIVYRSKGEFLPVADVYSIAAISDKKPKIKIFQPNSSLIEIPKNGKAQFELEAVVSDDFGITDVNIVASVAKGSGEAVKFRDKEFEFNNFTETENGRRYQKSWLLPELGMEPGDEVYFSIVAKDNKQPKNQEAKSSTIIVRWLDDEEVEMAAEGIRISFVPEYFRSQRQIIIETEQLIADRRDLSTNDFTEVSVDLGHSQSDLKQRFGQYLGDEVGEGPGEMLGLADGYHGGEDAFSGEASAGSHEHSETEHEDEIESQQQERPEIGHQHEDMLDANDVSGKSELIAQFAHSHGSGEIGPISKRDPKSWMKQAVHEMWQAELHLMLSEPEKALPYEYLAYKYLKLARQADRVYAKRLGFEPPPVSEEKRLTGELNDILNQSLSLQDAEDDSADSALLGRAHLLLSGHYTTKDGSNKLTVEHRNLLVKLRERLLELSVSRPILIKYAATLERILIENELVLTNCDNCVKELKKKLWQLMPKPLSLPTTSVRFNSSNEVDLKDFFIRVEQAKKGGGRND